MSRSRWMLSKKEIGVTATDYHSERRVALVLQATPMCLAQLTVHVNLFVKMFNFDIALAARVCGGRDLQ